MQENYVKTFDLAVMLYLTKIALILVAILLLLFTSLAGSPYIALVALGHVASLIIFASMLKPSTERTKASTHGIIGAAIATILAELAIMGWLMYIFAYHNKEGGPFGRLVLLLWSIGFPLWMVPSMLIGFSIGYVSNKTWQKYAPKPGTEKE